MWTLWRVPAMYVCTSVVIHITKRDWCFKAPFCNWCLERRNIRIVSRVTFLQSTITEEKIDDTGDKNDDKAKGRSSSHSSAGSRIDSGSRILYRSRIDEKAKGRSSSQSSAGSRIDYRHILLWNGWHKTTCMIDVHVNWETLEIFWPQPRVK